MSSIKITALKTIDDALGLYYKRFNVNYYDTNGIGIFMKYIIDEELDDPEIPIENELGDGSDPNDCAYLWVKDELAVPIPEEIHVSNEGKELFVFYLLQYCYKYERCPSTQEINDILTSKCGGSIIELKHDICDICDRDWEQCFCHQSNIPDENNQNSDTDLEFEQLSREYLYYCPYLALDLKIQSFSRRTYEDSLVNYCMKLYPSIDTPNKIRHFLDYIVRLQANASMINQYISKEDGKYIVGTVDCGIRNNGQPLYCTIHHDYDVHYRFTSVMTQSEIYHKYKVRKEHLPTLIERNAGFLSLITLKRNISEKDLNLTKWPKLKVFKSKYSRARSTIRVSPTTFNEYCHFSRERFSHNNGVPNLDSSRHIKNDSKLIPIAVLDTDANNDINYCGIEWVLIVRIIRQGFDVGVSFRFDNKTDSYIATGLYLDKDEIENRHKMLGLTDNYCDILQSFNGARDILFEGFRDYMRCDEEKGIGYNQKDHFVFELYQQVRDLQNENLQLKEDLAKMFEENTILLCDNRTLTANIKELKQMVEDLEFEIQEKFMIARAHDAVSDTDTDSDTDDEKTHQIGGYDTDSDADDTDVDNDWEIDQQHYQPHLPQWLRSMREEAMNNLLMIDGDDSESDNETDSNYEPDMYYENEIVCDDPADDPLVDIVASHDKIISDDVFMVEQCSALNDGAFIQIDHGNTVPLEKPNDDCSMSIRLSKKLTKAIIPNRIKEPFSDPFEYMQKYATIYQETAIKKFQCDSKTIQIVDYNIHCAETKKRLYVICEEQSKSKRNIWKTNDDLYTDTDILIKYKIAKLYLPKCLAQNYISTTEIEKLRDRIKYILQDTKKRNSMINIHNKSIKWNQRDKVPIFTKKNINSKTRLYLQLSKEEFVSRVKTFAQYNTNNINLIPIATIKENKLSPEIVWIVKIEQNICIGISWRYDEKLGTIIPSGIYLDCYDAHRLLLLEHECNCLDGFECIIDDLKIGNREQHQMKQLKQYNQSLKQQINEIKRNEFQKEKKNTPIQQENEAYRSNRLKIQSVVDQSWIIDTLQKQLNGALTRENLLLKILYGGNTNYIGGQNYQQIANSYFYFDNTGL